MVLNGLMRYQKLWRWHHKQEVVESSGIKVRADDMIDGIDDDR